METEREEGWGNLENARNAHYFRNNRSLCAQWMAWDPPRWEKHQDLGVAPTKGTCKACWHKRAKEEGFAPNAPLTGAATGDKDEHR